jgi:hypothetical protein
VAASTAPTVKAALLTLLRADSGLAGVQMDYGDPGPEIGQEQLMFGRTIQTEQDATLPPQRKSDENYDIEVYIYVAGDGNDAQACEERCWALVARLETVVKSNAGPNGALAASMVNAVGWVAMAGIEMTPLTVPGQRVAEALCKVHVYARK